MSASCDHTLRLWNLETRKEIATFTGEAYMCGCAVAPGGRTIIAGDGSGRVYFLRLIEAIEQSLHQKGCYQGSQCLATFLVKKPARCPWCFFGFGRLRRHPCSASEFRIFEIQRLQPHDCRITGDIDDHIAGFSEPAL